MPSSHPIHYFSVQSPKGGVGKTTLALYLARILLDDYNVLFIDFDLAGTNVAEACRVLQEQKLWKGKIHCVGDSYEGKNSSNSLANIVNLFAEYMSGKPKVNIEVQTELVGPRSKGNTLSLHDNQINVLGSYLLSPSGDINSLSLDDGASVLFDCLHASWFLEMIKELVNDCYQALKSVSPRKALAVIFDNAPGYSGLEPVLEDWLTDMGPCKAKFLFVASPDFQDRKAVSDAIRRVRGLYGDKQIAADAYRSSSDLSSFRMTKRQEAFFFRLVDSTPEGLKKCDSPKPSKSDHPECRDCELCFYRAGKAKDELQASSSFVQMVINKIPQEVADRKVREVVPTCGYLSQNISKILEENPLRGKRSIQFFPELAYQFCEVFLDRVGGNSRRKSAAVEILALERNKKSLVKQYEVKVLTFFKNIKMINQDIVKPLDELFVISDAVDDIYNKFVDKGFAIESGADIRPCLLLSPFLQLCKHIGIDQMYILRGISKERTKAIVLKGGSYYETVAENLKLVGFELSFSEASFATLLAMAFAVGCQPQREQSNQLASALTLIALLDIRAAYGRRSPMRGVLNDDVAPSIYEDTLVKLFAKRVLKDSSSKGIQLFYGMVKTLRNSLLHMQDIIEFIFDALQTFEGAHREPLIYGPALFALVRAVLGTGVISMQEGERLLRELGKPSVDLERKFVSLASSDFDKFKEGRFGREIEDVLNGVRRDWQL